MQTAKFHPLIRTYHRTIDIYLLRRITHRTHGNGLNVHEYRQNIVDHGLLSVLRPYPNRQPHSPRPKEADSSSSEPSNGEPIGQWDGSEQITELESLLRWRPSRGNRLLGLDAEDLGYVVG